MSQDGMILIGLGANLPSRFGPPEATLAAALERIGREDAAVVARSRFWRTRPVPDDGAPWYVNAVAALATALGPETLLAALLGIEAEFGRVRTYRNAPRLLDLDLLAYRDLRRDGPEPPLLPHPRLQERAFVLLPLAEIAPAWRHPRSGRSIAELIAALPPDQTAEPVAALAGR